MGIFIPTFPEQLLPCVLVKLLFCHISYTSVISHFTSSTSNALFCCTALVCVSAFSLQVFSLLVKQSFTAYIPHSTQEQCFHFCFLLSFFPFVQDYSLSSCLLLCLIPIFPSFMKILHFYFFLSSSVPQFWVSFVPIILLRLVYKPKCTQLAPTLGSARLISTHGQHNLYVFSFTSLCSFFSLHYLHL